MLFKSLTTAGALALFASPAFAQVAADAPTAFNMNTLFLAVFAILVMWMAAGFAMLEAGFVQEKNVANQCAKNVGLFAIATTCFAAFGYGFMFPQSWIIPGVFGFTGPISIGGVVVESQQLEGQERSESIGIFFQMMFCVAVASIVSGAVAERIRLIAFFIFTVIMTSLIYPIQASWAWGGGFLTTQFGFLDLAGSTVIHVVGGVAALTGSIVLGPRIGRYINGGVAPMPRSDVAMATLGAFILWMGWFGFNAGSYLTFATDVDADAVARILLNTNVAAAGGVIVASTISYLRNYRFDLGFLINGGLAGLVSITAEPLFPSPLLALIIGMAGGLIVFWTSELLHHLQIDDVVGAIPVHLFCGIWGTIAVVMSHPDATIFGQVAGVLVVTAFVGATSWGVWIALDRTIGIRVTQISEQIGNDNTEMAANA